MRREIFSIFSFGQNPSMVIFFVYNLTKAFIKNWLYYLINYEKVDLELVFKLK